MICVSEGQKTHPFRTLGRCFCWNFRASLWAKLDHGPVKLIAEASETDVGLQKIDRFDTARDTSRYLVGHFEIPLLRKSERRKSCNASFKVVLQGQDEFSAPRAGRIFRADT